MDRVSGLALVRGWALGGTTSPSLTKCPPSLGESISHPGENETCLESGHLPPVWRTLGGSPCVQEAVLIFMAGLNSGRRISKV